MMISNRCSMATTLVLGTAFAAFGLLELVATWSDEGWWGWLSTSGDLILGLILVLIGVIFLVAMKKYGEGTGGEAYAIVGSMLGLIAGAIIFFTFLANAFQFYVLESEDLIGWSPSHDLTPALLLVVPCALLLWHHIDSIRSERAKPHDVKA